MTGMRQQRVADLVREVLSDIIRRELRDPRLQLAGLTEVRLSPDLRHARIYVSHLDGAEAREAAVDGLNKAAPFLRRTLARQVRLRHIPELVFEPDTVLDQGARVEQLLREIRSESDPAAPEGDPGDGGDAP